MRITDLLTAERVAPDLQGRTQHEVLTELGGLVATGLPGSDPARVLAVLLERERLGSTGIGEGVAIPHGKLKSLDRIVAAFGRSRTGVDFGALDGQPARLFFVLVAPENSAGVHLKTLARISRLAKEPEFRRRLLDADSGDALFRAIAEEDAKY